MLQPWRQRVRGLMVLRGGNREIDPTGGKFPQDPRLRERKKEQGPGSARRQYNSKRRRKSKARQCRQCKEARTAAQAANDSDDSETRLSEKVFFFFVVFFFCAGARVTGATYSTGTQAGLNAARSSHAAKGQQACSQASEIPECRQGTAETPTAAKGPGTVVLWQDGVLTETANQAPPLLQ